MTVGQRISSIRKDKGLTIKDVSLMSKIAPGRISQIENDKANPSLNTLSAIANALDINISRLFEEDKADNMVIRGSERPLLHNDGKVKHYLLTNHDFGDVQFIYRVFEPGFSTDDHPEMNPDGVTGYEFAFVIEGKLLCEVEDKTYILNPGDSICFEAQKKHRIRNVHNTVTEVMWLNLRR